MGMYLTMGTYTPVRKNLLTEVYVPIVIFYLFPDSYVTASESEIGTLKRKPVQ